MKLYLEFAAVSIAGATFFDDIQLCVYVHFWSGNVCQSEYNSMSAAQQYIICIIKRFTVSMPLQLDHCYDNWVPNWYVSLLTSSPVNNCLQQGKAPNIHKISEFHNFMVWYVIEAYYFTQTLQEFTTFIVLFKLQVSFGSPENMMDSTQQQRS